MKYVIEGGQQGKARLHLLSAAMNHHSLAALQAAGLKPGDHCLDLGCGGGHMTLDIADVVGKEGKATGMDNDTAIIKLAAEDAVAQGYENVQFIATDACNLHDENKYDVIYARYLLSHLKDPADLLKKIYVALKSGGVFVTEDIQFSGHFCYPHNEAFETYMRWYPEAVKKNGADAEIGPRLSGYLRDAGFMNVTVNVVQPAASFGPAKKLSLVTLERIKTALITESITKEQEYNEVYKAMEAFTNDESSVISMARTWQAWGKKD